MSKENLRYFVEREDGKKATRKGGYMRGASWGKGQFYKTEKGARRLLSHVTTLREMGKRDHGTLYLKTIDLSNGDTEIILEV